MDIKEKMERLGFEAKIRLNAMKTRAACIAYDVKQWARENPQEAAAAGVAIVLSALKYGNTYMKNVNIERQAELDNRTFWDPSAGCHVTAKKHVTESQKREFAERRQAGETVTEALANMKLI